MHPRHFGWLPFAGEPFNMLVEAFTLDGGQAVVEGLAVCVSVDGRGSLALVKILF
jgi:hypothetical protein